MLIIYYSEEGPPISDFKIEEEVKDLIEQELNNSLIVKKYYTSNLALIMCMKATILWKYPSVNDSIKYYFHGKEIIFGSDYTYEDYANAYVEGEYMLDVYASSINLLN